MRLVLLYSFLIFGLTVLGQTVKELERSKQDLEKKISLTNSLLSQTRKSKSSSLHELEIMKNKIVLEANMLDNLNAEIKSLDITIKEVDTEVVNLEEEIGQIKDEYARLIYTSWKMSKAGKQFHYILAGYDLGMVYRRFRYIIAFNQFMRKQAELLTLKQQDLGVKKQVLLQTKNEKKRLLNEKNDQLARLSTSKKEKELFVSTLQKKERTLKSQLSEQQKKINELEKFIQEIIKKELEAAAKNKTKTGFDLTPEEKLLGESFADNKGRLPWPLAQGIVVQKFGNYKPEGLDKVSLNSNGLDFATSIGGDARAVFNGEVIGVYALPGYNTGVIVKHGNFFTFYANLEEVYVKKGQSVSVKQPIGKVFTDNEKGKSILHFEIYQDKTVLNPELWLTR